MADISEYNPGTFCWSELNTTDPAAAKRFYSELFGWTADDRPAGPDMVYSILQLGGQDAAALVGLDAERRSQGVPPHWLSYVSVASADDAAAHANRLGATVLAGPFDVMDVGRMAVVQDPKGANFALWQPGRHIGARRVNEPGALTWNELATRDTEAAGKFYSDLFGWTRQEQEMKNLVYTRFESRGRPMGGMLPIPSEWGTVPPHWLVYFGVDDCDAGIEKARGLGAEVRVPAMEANGLRFAVLVDPQGAPFGIVQMPAK